jgi:catechol 2,3-dioxygenase-like lactoylglutathione lyase family enzyme
MKPRISMIALAVQDLSVSQRFYEEGLGFPRLDSPPSVAFFNLNGTWLGLSERQALADDAGVPADGSGYRGFSLAHNVASEQEVDALIDLAIVAGAKLIKAPTRASWGGYHAYFSDPDGHLWEIAHNPFFWVGPTDDDD